jgi:opacity protein-like surface antigen
MEATLVMKILTRLLAASAATTLLLAAAPAAAQVSVSVYGGYLAGTGLENATTQTDADVKSSGAFMLVLGTDLDGARELQLQFAQQSTTLAPGGGADAFDLTIRYLHVGGTAFVGGPIGRGAYAVGGIGATFFSPSASGYGSDTKPSLNIGFGYYWPLTERVALRAEARGFFTLVDSSGGFLCSGGCVAVIKGDLFTQYGAMLGLTARF